VPVDDPDAELFEGLAGSLGCLFAQQFSAPFRRRLRGALALAEMRGYPRNADDQQD